MPPRASYGLRAPALHADLAPILARARREAPVQWDPTLGTWVLARWAEVAAAPRDQANLAIRGLDALPIRSDPA